MQEFQQKRKAKPGLFVLVGVLLIGVVIGAFKYMGFGLSDLTGSAKPDSTETRAGTPQTDSAAQNVSLQDVRMADNSASVGIVAPPQPVNGKIRSVSMVGPSGVFNSITLTDGRNYKLIKKSFVPKLINEQSVSTEDIKAILEKNINDSWNNGIKSNGDIQIVVASSVANNPKVQQMIPEFKKTYVVTTTTSETEGAAAFKVAVAPQYRDTAFVMDVTPTIIRFTYNAGNSTKTVVAKTGSKYYQNEQTEEQAMAEIRSVISQIPRSNQQLCIVLWAAAEKDLRQGENRYASIPSYTGEERATKTGLALINEVKSLTNANMVLDFESMWFSGF